MSSESLFCAFCVDTSPCFSPKWGVLDDRYPLILYQWPIWWTPLYGREYGSRRGEAAGWLRNGRTHRRERQCPCGAVLPGRVGRSEAQPDSGAGAAAGPAEEIPGQAGDDRGTPGMTGRSPG